MKKYQYTVTVGNIGNIQFTNKQDAVKSFEDYKNQSRNGIGRASGETVTLFKNGEIIDEYMDCMGHFDENGDTYL